MVELEPITITATRSEAPIEQQPYAIYRTTNEDLNFGIGRTALDRMNYGPGVLIQRTAPAQASPFIRGLTGEQTLLLFDGVRLSHAMMRPGPNQYAAMIPGHSLQSIDVILGSSSVVQGSDGLTGAMDFRLTPAGGDSTNMSSWVRAKADHANGSSIALGYDSGASKSHWLYSIDASFEDYHDRIGGKDSETRLLNSNAGQNVIPNTAYDQYSLGSRLAYLGAEAHRLELNFGKVSQNDAPRPDGYAENSFNTSRDFRRYEQQAFTYLHLRDRWDLDQSWAQKLTTTFAWHLHEEDQHRGQISSGNYRLREYDDEIDSKSLDLEFQSGFGAHHLTWGATFIKEETANSLIDSRQTGGNTTAVGIPAGSSSSSTSAPDGSEYQTLGLYVQNDHQLGGGWNLLYGLRYSRFEWEYPNANNGGAIESSSVSDLTWNLRGQYSFSETSRIFAGVSRAFRAPNLVNLAGYEDRGSNAVFTTGSSDLDPETSITTELGYNLAKEKLKLATSLFDTRVDDLIARDVNSATNSIENVETAHIYGFELDTSYQILGESSSTWKTVAFTTASYVRATMEIDLNGAGTLEDNISRANRLFGRTGLTVEHENGFRGLFQTRWHDAYDKVATWSGDSDSSDVRLTVPGDATGAMPGYAVFDIRMDWLHSKGKRQFGIGIENIFNKTYREPGSGADGAGRNVFVEACLKY